MPHQRSEQPTRFELTAWNEFNPLGGLPLEHAAAKVVLKSAPSLLEGKVSQGSARHSSLQDFFRSFSCSEAALKISALEGARIECNRVTESLQSLHVVTGLALGL
jgi:hypothetical protein